MEELQRTITNIMEGASRSLIDTISIHCKSFLSEELTLLEDANTKYAAFFDSIQNVMMGTSLWKNWMPSVTVSITNLESNRPTKRRKTKRRANNGLRAIVGDGPLPTRLSNGEDRPAPPPSRATKDRPPPRREYSRSRPPQRKRSCNRSTQPPRRPLGRTRESRSPPTMSGNNSKRPPCDRQPSERVSVTRNRQHSRERRPSHDRQRSRYDVSK